VHHITGRGLIDLGAGGNGDVGIGLLHGGRVTDRRSKPGPKRLYRATDAGEGRMKEKGEKGEETR
jgi:hypothetical protein